MSKLHQFNKKMPCYFCGKPGPSTKEHVPPKLLTSVSDCDRITVPACEKHNSSKGGTDQAIVTALIRGIDQIAKHGIRSDISGNVGRIIKATSAEYDRTKASVYMQRFATRLPAKLDFDLPYIRAHVDISDWITKLTAALVWSITGKYDNGSEWDGAWNWSPSYLSAKVAMTEGMALERAKDKKYQFKEFENSGQWRQGWAPGKRPYPPDLYSFRVCIENQRRSNVRVAVFRHSFLSSFVFFSRFTTSELVERSIAEFAGEVVPPVEGIEYWLR